MRGPERLIQQIVSMEVIAGDYQAATPGHAWKRRNTPLAFAHRKGRHSR
jgi:hypothetical protein